MYGGLFGGFGKGEVGMAAFAQITGFTTQHFIMATDAQPNWTAGAAVFKVFPFNRLSIETVGGIGAHLKQLEHDGLPFAAMGFGFAKELETEQMADFVGHYFG